MNKLASILILATCAALIAAPAPRTVKAKVEEPVLPELMGGCSMRCTFAWSVEVVEDGKVRPSKLLNDEKAETAWLAAGAQGGVGTKIRMAFPKKIPAEMEGHVPMYGLDVINGAWENEDQFRTKGRIKKARLLYNDKPICDVQFADSRRWQRIEFDDIMIRSGDVVTLEILEIYPGKEAGLAISELVLQGAH